MNVVSEAWTDYEVRLKNINESYDKSQIKFQVKVTNPRRIKAIGAQLKAN